MSEDLKERLRANSLDECDEAIARIATLEAQLAAAVSDRDAAVAAALEEEAGEIRSLWNGTDISSNDCVTPDMLAQARADGMREAAEIAEKERDTFAAETRQEKISGTPNSVLVAAGRVFGAGYVATSILAAIEKGEG